MKSHVMEKMKDKGKNTIMAHLKHLKDHGETGFLHDGVTYLKAHKSELNFNLEEVMMEVHNHGKIPVAEKIIPMNILMKAEAALDQEQW